MAARYKRICIECEVRFKTMNAGEFRCTECRKGHVEEERFKQDLLDGKLDDVDDNGEEEYVGLEIEEGALPRLGGEWDNFIRAHEDAICEIPS